MIGFDAVLRSLLHWNSVDNMEAFSMLIWKDLKDTLFIHFSVPGFFPF